jgi:hypothetical protein
MSKPRTLSLLLLPFDRLIDLFVTRLFIKHDGSCKIIAKLKPLIRRNDEYGSH